MILSDGKEITFPLNDDDQICYYSRTAFDTNGTTYEVYEIEGKYYDVLGNELNADGTDKKEEALEEPKDMYWFDAHTSLKEINGIIAKFKELMDEKGVRPDDLVGTGAIYYANANDGTDFDWSVNDNTCEFFMYYKSTELGFAKLYVCKDGSLKGYYWGEEGHGQGEPINVPNFTEYPDEFAALCYEQADMKGLFDKSINMMDWDAPVESTYYDWLGNYEDDEEWYEEEEYYDEEDEEY